MKIVQGHQKCIGCGSCVAMCSKYWEMSDDGKAKLIGSKLNSDGNYELGVEEIGCNEDAIEVWPVQCIHANT